MLNFLQPFCKFLLFNFLRNPSLPQLHDHINRYNLLTIHKLCLFLTYLIRPTAFGSFLRRLRIRARDFRVLPLYTYGVVCLQNLIRVLFTNPFLEAKSFKKDTKSFKNVFWKVLPISALNFITEPTSP